MKENLPNSFPFRIAERFADFVTRYRRQYGRKSDSQEGEGLILERIFEGQKAGVYVDVGAHHPIRFSNTHRFYKRGWHGINIEPNPTVLNVFQRQRRRDINLGFGVAENEGLLVYFMFNEPALNSFDRVISENRRSERYKIVAIKDIAVKRLSTILEEYLPACVHIDFMSVDVEGYDLQVLRSNDWSRFRPTCLLVESTGFDLGNIKLEPMHRFLELSGYDLFAKTVNTLFHLDRARNPQPQHSADKEQAEARRPYHTGSEKEL